MTGVAMNTVLKLLVELGAGCAELHDERVRDIHAKRTQCDEIWQFCYAKAKNVPQEKRAFSDSGTCGRGLASTATRS
jgi:hypothetical protein